MTSTAEFYVYTHTRNDTGEIFYVGKGKNRRAWNKSLRSDYWRKIEAKHGVTVDLFKANLAEDCAFSIEKFLIHSFRRAGHNLINFTTGGEGRSGHSASAETRAKQSAAKMGGKLSAEHAAKIALANTGKRRTEDQKANMSRTFSAEHRAALSKSLTGRKLSQDHVAKMSANKMGRPAPASYFESIKGKLSGLRNPHSSHNIYTFSHPDHGSRVCTQFELRRDFSLTHSNLSRLVSGKRKMVGGWKIVKE